MKVIKQGHGIRLCYQTDPGAIDDSHLDTLPYDRQMTSRAEFWERVHKLGVWILSGQYMCPCCGQWKTSASLGQLIGIPTEDTDDASALWLGAVRDRRKALESLIMDVERLKDSTEVTLEGTIESIPPITTMPIDVDSLGWGFDDDDSD